MPRGARMRPGQARVLAVLWLSVTLGVACAPSRRPPALPSGPPPTAATAMSSPPAGRGTTPVATGTGVGPAAVVPRNVTGSAIVVGRGSVSRRSGLRTFDAGADTGL